MPRLIERMFYARHMGANRRYTRDLDDPSYQPRHVWLRTSDRAPTWPGVLVEWKRTEDGWRARVAYASREGHVSDGWFPPEQVQPLGPQDPISVEAK